MRFLVDEQLPSLLVDVLISKGHEAIHVSTLGSDERVSDSMIIQESMDGDCVVITKDNSFLITNQSKKLVYVVTGNIKNRELLNLFRLLTNWLSNSLYTA
ncbi:DUF5615 family PIN-like protein [Fibrella forsythiae]|uniref:DUF5615 family PIN-like protein n=1 Tax=Fibrella forsythiae TaxID=2817061 RepID=A0ABS3JJ00_9BACT|nr:DUF5615 family PIN-like protein [Fibrella forsythiae]MBO0949990.1 DUF5615 family PIN-like protein [Fibrella forsythiae]